MFEGGKTRVAGGSQRLVPPLSRFGFSGPAQVFGRTDPEPAQKLKDFERASIREIMRAELRQRPQIPELRCASMHLRFSNSPFVRAEFFFTRVFAVSSRVSEYDMGNLMEKDAARRH
jgi:hypothetical protein